MEEAYSYGKKFSGLKFRESHEPANLIRGNLIYRIYTVATRKIFVAINRRCIFRINI